MNRDSEQYRSLRKLLALKRHEQPPPGYFDRFSGSVIARIQAGETAGAWYERIPWVQRVTDLFGARPAFAGAFGAAVCALFIFGVVLSDQTEVDAGGMGHLAGGTGLQAFPSAAPLAMTDPAEQPSLLSTTNPVDASIHALFDIHPTARPVSLQYQVPAGQ